MAAICLALSLQDAAETLGLGIVGSMVWLLLLFSLKPKLELRADPKGGGYLFVARNRGMARAVGVEARLWIVKMDSWPREYTRVDLKQDRLLTLNGRWQAGRRPTRLIREGTYGTEFGFQDATGNLVTRVEHAYQNGAHVQVLFQVWAQHGFTNFGRSTPAWFALVRTHLGEPALRRRDMWSDAHPPAVALVRVIATWLSEH
jgi:hypothetical protein